MTTVLTIHSNLEHFQLLDRIDDVTPISIGASCYLKKVPAYLVLEAMAQLAALHVRHLVAFERHAFLLKVSRYDMPALELSPGRYHLAADQVKQSSHAFFYRVASRGPCDESYGAELLIGTQAYDGRFQKKQLKAHYRKRFHGMK